MDNFLNRPMRWRVFLPLLTLAILLGLWISPGRAFAAPVERAVERPVVARVACPTDEGDQPGPCVWDARHLGNGIGRSFVIRRSGLLLYVSHARAHYLLWRV